MIKKLLTLNGLAIVAVVLNHSVLPGYLAMFQWVDLYSSVEAPNWGAIGSIEYYIMLPAALLPHFSVPSFIFVAGFFAAYAARGSKGKINWKNIKANVIHLIIPYIIWSIMIFLFDYIFEGNIYSPIGYLRKLFFDGAQAHYYFVPLLCYLYLLSPLLVAFAKARWKLLLIISALIQLSGVLIHYVNFRTEIPIPGSDIFLFLTQPWSPIMWVLYFALGITFSLYLKSFKQWLEKYKYLIYICLILSATWMLVDADYRFKTNLDPTKGHPVVYFGMITFVVYSILVIFSFLLINNFPFSKTFNAIGPKSYGIYLIHYTILYVTAKFMIEFTPAILAYRFVIIPLLFILGLGIPLLLMKIVSATPLRKSQRYLFG